MTALTRLAPICLIALTLGACEEIVIEGLTPEPEAPPARVLPAAVRAALLPGVPDSIVVEDGLGCYLVSIELTEPRTGYLVNDANGEPLCYDDLGNRVPRQIPPVLPPFEPAAETTAQTDATGAPA